MLRQRRVREGAGGAGLGVGRGEQLHTSVAAPSPAFGATSPAPPPIPNPAPPAPSLTPVRRMTHFYHVDNHSIKVVLETMGGRRENLSQVCETYRMLGSELREAN